MKKYVQFILILLLITSPLIVRAQDEGDISQLYLKGKWIATCPTEIVNSVTIRNCELCSFVVTPENKSLGMAMDIEMTFMEDTIVINRMGKVSVIPYKKNKDNHSIKFNFNNKDYDFRLFLYNDQRVIEDKDGLILVLTKSK